MFNFIKIKNDLLLLFYSRFQYPLYLSMRLQDLPYRLSKFSTDLFGRSKSRKSKLLKNVFLKSYFLKNSFSYIAFFFFFRKHITNLSNILNVILNFLYFRNKTLDSIYMTRLANFSIIVNCLNFLF